MDRRSFLKGLGGSIAVAAVMPLVTSLKADEVTYGDGILINHKGTYTAISDTMEMSDITATGDMWMDFQNEIIFAWDGNYWIPVG